MTQTAIPFLFMRGGSSRGPYMRRDDLPDDPETLARVLVAIIGSGHPLNIDGIGGGAAVTTKVAMLSASEDDWADVDYLFAQVSVEDGLVDFKPTCGNILVGVGPAAIEMGLVNPKTDVTDVRIRAVNTGARVLSGVQTRNDAVQYDGEAQIDGVPGTAAPVSLMFREVVGGTTGAMFPTGKRIEVIDGIEVTCMDVAMPMVIARAADFGLTGHESASGLDDNRAFFARMEAIRQEAGALMGMGDVSSSVAPKFGLLAPARGGGTAAVRYFMPWSTHPTLAVTGSQCLSACLLCPGTVGDGIATGLSSAPAHLTLEHPMGVIEVVLDYRIADNSFDVISAGLVRTARKLASGDVFVPQEIWARD
ncbi:4-oxalomesaconate tautomerase [Roseobacter sp. YSTF-M11]|uniref:4-oxalomesaconate tautomerase n=1 Tax=Roseobacter insulae TaxID=2859783 RepID=A0A9X1JZT1_9RHOB|nr:4-oxalomesaconate tautomerase [Roseobacter insulae]MBW4709726.1 4-oxalomesaconate tautomerase [Roseobacter insulae]